MALTTNIKLLLTGADEVGMTFLEWRTAINGIGNNSNMELIDAAIGELMKDNDGKADGFSFDSNTGVLQLTSGGKPLSGANTSVTINLRKYYTKEEVDQVIADLEENLAGNDALQEIHTNAVGDVEWSEDSRTMTLYDLNGGVKRN